MKLRVCNGDSSGRTTFDSDENLYTAWRAGASGFLLKVSPPEQPVAAICLAASGAALLDPAVTTRVIAAFAHQPSPQPPPALASRRSSTAHESGVVHIGKG